jgi:pimeloyl-ACP methyl ester carboxylesterase
MAPTGMTQGLRVDDERIEYDDVGAGEPILLVHAGAFSDWFGPVAVTAELSGFRVIRVRRAGYVTGSVPSRHLSISDHARHCGLLLDALGLSKAHVCGHSSGALVGLQLVLDRPDLVQSLVLLDPAPGSDLLGPINAPTIDGVIGPVMAAYAAGDTAVAFDRFMTAVCGSHHRSVMEHALGVDGYAQAVRESAFFPDEVAAVGEWQFGATEASRIHVPMLLVDGGTTAAVAAVRPESVSRLAVMVPHASVAVLAGASHLMPLEDPSGVARLIADFTRAHPITA